MDSTTKLEEAPYRIGALIAPRLVELVGWGVRTIFGRQGPGWAPLHPRTVRERVRLGHGPTPILVRSGRLLAALSEPGAPGHVTHFAPRGFGSFRILIGTRDPRFAPLQYGAPGRNLPARPMLPVDYPEVEELVRLQADLLVRDAMDEAVK